LGFSSPGWSSVQGHPLARGVLCSAEACLAWAARCCVRLDLVVSQWGGSVGI